MTEPNDDAIEITDTPGVTTSGPNSPAAEA
jgi:hypothetical protein